MCLTKQFFVLYEDLIGEQKTDWETQATYLPSNTFEGFENRLGIHFPFAYKHFIRHWSQRLNAIKVNDIILPLFSSEFGGMELEEVLFYQLVSRQALDMGLIPIGYYREDYLICMDYRRPVSEPPIVLVENFSDTIYKENISELWFSSFDKMLACLHHYIQYKNKKDFKKIDPENQFASAFPYWNNKYYTEKTHN